MKRVYVDLDDALRLVTSQAKQNLQWIEDNGKLGAFYNLIDEMFNDNVRLSEIDDYLKYEMEDICNSLGIKPSWEDEEVFEESSSSEQNIENKLWTYIMELADPADIPNSNESIDKLITWIFEHNKRAYKRNFWKNIIGLTDKDIDKYNISLDLEESLSITKVNKLLEEALGK